MRVILQLHQTFLSLKPKLRFSSCFANANHFMARIVYLLCFTATLPGSYSHSFPHSRPPHLLPSSFFSSCAPLRRPSSPRSNQRLLRAFLSVRCCVMSSEQTHRYNWYSGGAAAAAIATAIPSSPSTPPADSGVGNTLVTFNPVMLCNRCFWGKYLIFRMFHCTTWTEK